MTPASSQRRSVSLLVIVALVVTTLVSGFARAPAHAASFVDPVLGVVTLCTPSATATNSDDVPGQTALAEHCPLCTLLAPLALAPSLATTLVVFRDACKADKATHALAWAAARLHLGGVGSRAPPPSA
jgi:hypothetical protein